jgi:hypothetical protein
MLVFILVNQPQTDCVTSRCVLWYNPQHFCNSGSTTLFLSRSDSFKVATRFVFYHETRHYATALWKYIAVNFM